ncbi:hypothetical protein CHS0354_039640 [Potamilus streckersoni]|uniref:Uncharacterized protein n=1 Tax=Potamilus streckersoni TaxID=2493646 RepID=A0AAE0SK25_9BIVA|nr:hypothetical protein CHS0354_039640 [Potamilus streckersoni]
MKDMKDKDSEDDEGMIEEEEQEEEKDLKEFSLGTYISLAHEAVIPELFDQEALSFNIHAPALLVTAEEELETDGSEIPDVEGRKEAFSHLANTLSNLIQRLENTEKEISAVDQELEEMNKQTDGQDFSSQSEVLPPTAKTPQEQEPGKKGEDAANLKETKSSTDKSSDNKLRVRVTRLKSGGHQSEGEKTSLDSGSSKVTDQLEEKLTQGLREAGVNAGKIQVKIITAGYYDDKDGKVQLLSEEDSETFKNIIVSIIGGSAEADKEEHKHTRMQDNYNFVWQKDNKQQVTASENDGDDSKTAKEIKK